MKLLFYHILLTAIYFRVLNSFWTCEFTNLPLGEHISISIGPSVWIYHRSITANITLYALLTYTGLIRFSVHLAFWVCSPVSSKSPWKRWGSSEMIKAVQMIVSPSVLLVPSQVDTYICQSKKYVQNVECLKIIFQIRMKCKYNRKPKFYRYS